MVRDAIVLASDSFKGSATSREVESYLEEGLRRVLPDVPVVCVPIADGGEGTLDALAGPGRAVRVSCTVEGPAGGEVQAAFGMCSDGSAVIEMAEAAGLALNAGHAGEDASTFGVGQLIEAALDAGAQRILVGLGGSATSDGGKGMAEALGVRFLDGAGEEVEPGLAGLEALREIDCTGIDPRLKDTEVLGLTDVTNPLAGPSGAIAVFGPQKGLAAGRLDAYGSWMARYGLLVEEATGTKVADVPGAGAAGGLGAGLLAFAGARLVSGIDCVLDEAGFDDLLGCAALVITGEGRMDGQSIRGKAPVGVARRAKRQGVPVIAVVGSRADDIEAVYAEGIDLVLTTLGSVHTLAECMERVSIDIPLAGESAGRIFQLMHSGQAGSF